MHGKSAQIIMFVSGKGGTGKTSVCAHVGASLAQTGKKVLCVELGSGPPAIDYPCGAFGNVVYNLNDVFKLKCSPAKAVVKSEIYDNLYALCTNNGECVIEPIIFANTMHELSAYFDYILLDVQSGYGLPLHAAKVVAHRAILVLSPDRLALRGGQMIKDALKRDGEIKTHLIINNVQPQLINSGIIDLDEIIDETQTQLIGVVPECMHIKNSANTGARLPENCKSHMVFNAIAARLCNVQMPLVFKY